MDLSRFAGFDIIGSRGCPFSCRFCAVATLWGSRATFRSPAAIVAEMQGLHERAGAELFLFQDDLFTSSREHVLRFCNALRRSGLKVQYKVLGRIDLVDEKMLRALADTGCVNIRFGIESGAPDLRRSLRKELSDQRILDVVQMACQLFPIVDLFFIWGFPFESMEDFNRSAMQMVALEMMGANIVPSLFCLAPQNPLSRGLAAAGRLEFAPDLFPEQMLTGHETISPEGMEILPEHRGIYDLIEAHPEIFPGFHHLELNSSIRPKLRVLRELGIYPS